jgi:PAS domain S-box-containing protein
MQPSRPPPPQDLKEAPLARILMVDDHAPNLVALEAILQPLRQELVTATSGEDALRKVLASDFAVILMDVQMPGIDGLQTAKLIKERQRNRHVPIIFLTAIHKDPRNIFRGYEEGAVDYLLKPFEPQILRAKVQVFVDLWRMGELLRRQQAMLRAQELVEVEKRSELRFHALTDSMPQCVWAAKADGEIYYCNRVWREYAGDEAGITFFEAVPEEEFVEVREEYRAAVRKGETLTREQQLRRHDGVYRWHLARMVPERDGLGRITGWICTATDIDENRRLLASEKEARSQAEIANRTKDEFLATVSHELRTPLNAILGWTRMLRSGAVEQKSMPRVLETIERNARAQTQLVEDILDVSRIIAGKMRVDIRFIDLHGVVRAALESVRPAAEARGVELAAEMTPESAEFCGDPDRLQQVIWNLLSNAIKFTPRGGRVSVSVDRQDSQARIVVSDTGSGIPRDFLPHVFDRFRQADSSITRAQGGLGLGLAIVRHLIEVHGGTVEARSDGENQGSTFTVCMPLRAVAGGIADERKTPAGDLEVRLDGIEVLVVDDEPDARELVSAVLTRSGARVRQAASLEDALARLREQKFDVLLSDIGLPQQDGYALMRRVRELSPAEGGLVQAAALTAYAGEDDQRRALAAGFQAHVTKPIEPADLTLLVSSLSGRAHSEARRKSEMRSEPPPETRTTDLTTH